MYPIYFVYTPERDAHNIRFKYENWQNQANKRFYWFLRSTNIHFKYSVAAFSSSFADPHRFCIKYILYTEYVNSIFANNKLCDFIPFRVCFGVWCMCAFLIFAFKANIPNFVVFKLTLCTNCSIAPCISIYVDACILLSWHANAIYFAADPLVWHSICAKALQMTWFSALDLYSKLFTWA